GGAAPPRRTPQSPPRQRHRLRPGTPRPRATPPRRGGRRVAASSLRRDDPGAEPGRDLVVPLGPQHPLLTPAPPAPRAAGRPGRRARLPPRPRRAGRRGTPAGGGAPRGPPAGARRGAPPRPEGARRHTRPAGRAPLHPGGPRRLAADLLHRPRPPGGGGTDRGRGPARGQRTGGHRPGGRRGGDPLRGGGG